MHHPVKIAAVAAALALSLVGCSTAGATPDGDGESDTFTIAMLPRATNINYFVSASAGAEAAAEELGDTYSVVGPTEITAAAQLPFIQTLTTQGVDGILLAANDPNALLPALEKAAAQDIATVTFDSDTAVDGRTVFINQATSDGIGAAEIQQIAEAINFTGKFAVIASSETSPNESAWIEGMNAELEKPEYADMELVKIAYGVDDAASFTAAQGLMQAYPDLAGIVGTNSFAISATARAVEAAGRGGEVQVSGLGTPNDLREYVKNGTIKSFVLWSPYDLGYLATYAMHALLAGDITGAEGETFDAGSLGEREIGENGEVILNPPTVFNADNIDDFDF